MLGLREHIVRKKLQSAFILSVGTATVLDKITIKSERAVDTQEVIHEGGYIIPGFSLMERSLEFLTTKLETTQIPTYGIPIKYGRVFFVWHLYRSGCYIFHNTKFNTNLFKWWES